MSGRVSSREISPTIKENYLTNLQNVLAHETAIWYFPALYFAAETKKMRIIFMWLSSRISNARLRQGWRVKNRRKTAKRAVSNNEVGDSKK
jgi:hypothetical protein